MGLLISISPYTTLGQRLATSAMAHRTDSNRDMPSNESVKIAMWKEALRNPPKPYVELPPVIPSAYTLVSKAGSGLSATVYFCLPKTAVKAPTSKESDVISQAAKKLASELQVVKVFANSGSPFMRPELTILKEIQQQRQGQPEELPLIELLAWDTTNAVPDWITMSTMPICCDLASLTGCFDQMPEEFIWLVYTQVYRALDFLHNTCNIAHGDLHIGNVIVGYSASNHSGLPEVKLIDFGLSQCSPFESRLILYMNLFDKDIEGLLRILESILQDLLLKCALCDWCLEARFNERCAAKICNFYKTVDHELGSYSYVSSSLPAKLWKDYGSHAKDTVDSCSDTSRKHIRDVILNTTKIRREVNEAKIEEILATAYDEASTSCSVQ